MTAWATPAVYSHGDYPIAANLNKFSNGQLHIYEKAPDILFCNAVPYITSGEYMRFVHRHRYLHYKSSGQLVDNVVGQVEETISLPNTTDDWVNVYDLDQVSWLSYGAVYYVTGVDFCQEHATP